MRTGIHIMYDCEIVAESDLIIMLCEVKQIGSYDSRLARLMSP